MSRRHVRPLLVALFAVAALLSLEWAVSGKRGGHDPGLDPSGELQQVEPPSPPMIGERIPVPETASSVGDATPKAREALARLVGRCVDRSGHGLEEARVRIVSSGKTTTCEPDGGFELDVDLGGDLSATLEVEADLGGFVSARSVVTVRSGTLIDVGDLLLERGASLAGFVRTEDDEPIAGAEVSLQRADGPARRSPKGDPTEVMRTTRSDARGSFRFEGLAPDEVRAWARAVERDWAVSDPVRLEPGLESLPVILRPPLLAASGLVELTVLDPSGDPVPGARVSFLVRWAGGSRSATLEANENGHLAKVLDPVAPHSFVARDPEGRYRAAVARDVPPGTRDLVLRLKEMRSFRLTVDDGFGTPVREYRASLEDAEGPLGELIRSGDGPHLDGVTSLEVPDLPFLVRVEAEGYRTGQLGPLDPMSLPDVVELHLEPLGPCLGRVLCSGRGIAGAHVTLHEAAAEGEAFLVNALPCRSLPATRASAICDDEGRFQLSVRETGRYYLRAEAAGLPPGDLGPLELGPDAPDSNWTIELASEGGAIAGRILSADPSAVANRIVGVSRGDGFGVSARTDANGTFLFEGLSPGPWLVRELQEDARRSMTHASRISVEPGWTPPWTCHVQPGRTTPYDLDRSDVPVVKGRLRLSGLPAAGWVASLSPEAGQGETASASLDSQGRFELALHEGGAFRLNVKRPTDQAFAQDYLDLVAGENTWDVDLPIGSLEVTAELERLEPGSPLYFTWTGSGRLRFFARLAFAESGTRLFEDLPAGRVAVVYSEPGGRQGKTSTDLPEGGSSRVVVPASE